MKKKRYSLYCDAETMALIDKAAEINDISRSAVAAMFLQLVRYVPVDRLRETSPVPTLLGINTKEAIHASN